VESVTDYIYTVEVKNGSPVRTIHGPGCVTVTGYTPEDYRADPDLWHRMIFEEDRPAVLNQASKVLTGTPVAPFEHRIIHKDGSLRWVRNAPVPRFGRDGGLVAYDGLITDITSLKLLENQLRQAQKMEAVGQLAGGIAHDFNNILTAIIGYANLLMMKLPEDDPGRAYVDPIIQSAERAAHLTSNLLAFSRKQIINLKPVSVNDIIRRVEKLLVRVIGEDIAFRTRLSSDDHAVLADSIQIEHVLMNLATNARDAMPDGGTLVVETDAYELGEEFVRAHSYGKPGRYVLITVTDSGIGMDENVLSHVFEPFFTTKEIGKGTGLGLSMVYGIIKQHNGYITVASEPGKGTTFKLYLPLITAATVGDKIKNSAAVKRGKETVLLAEDDTPVRELTRRVLEGAGYTVIETSDGAEAVSTFKNNKDTIGLVVLDIIMPRKNGKEACMEIRAIRPDIKALFMSGYTADIIHKKGILETGMDVILKPITPSNFLIKVREVLDRA
jgi:PAS domain S-box-containing protein